ncbi:MAG: hypothetical protein HGA49_12180 [Eubacteriaceae bacterium]|nr:hypothetical protein [Eubacteriaceae bacterium]
MKRKIIIIMIISAILLISGCSNQDVLEEESTKKDAKIKALEKKITQLEEKNTLLEEELDYDGKFIETMTGRILEADLITLAQSEWSYSLKVNDKAVPADGIVFVESNTFDFTAAEVQNAYIALPAELHEKGKISGSLFSNHIKFLDSKPSDTSGSNEDKLASATYVFKELADGNEINLEISAELQQRLGMTTNVIKVIVKLPPATTK